MRGWERLGEIEKQAICRVSYAWWCPQVAPGGIRTRCPKGHVLDYQASRNNGWACDGRKEPGGCKKGCTGRARALCLPAACGLFSCPSFVACWACDGPRWTSSTWPVCRLPPDDRLGAVHLPYLRLRSVQRLPQQHEGSQEGAETTSKPKPD